MVIVHSATQGLATMTLAFAHSRGVSKAGCQSILLYGYIDI